MHAHLVADDEHRHLALPLDAVQVSAHHGGGRRGVAFAVGLNATLGGVGRHKRIAGAGVGLQQVQEVAGCGVL